MNGKATRIGRFGRLRFAAAALAALWLALAPDAAQAEGPPSWLQQRLAVVDAACACLGDEALTAQRDRIATAADAEEARSLALADARSARQALGRARWMAPWSHDIDQAHGDLVRFESRVAALHDPEAIAVEYAALTQLASVESGDIGAHGADACDYSRGEIIAIVLGFLFGILPGLILLVLLC